jgi:ribosomal protein S15P/S13E
MKSTIYVMFRDHVKLKENMLKHKKDVCSKRMFATQRKMFTLEDY